MYHFASVGIGVQAQAPHGAEDTLDRDFLCFI
jgi:hypothetical protein